MKRHTTATEAIAVRLTRLEGSYEQIDKRLGAIEADLRELRHDLGQKFTLHISRIDRQMYWLVGILVTNLASLTVSAVVLLASR